MRIVHVIGAAVAGGAERFVASLLKRMKADGADVALWALSDRQDEVGRDSLSVLERSNITCLKGPTARIGWKSVRWYAEQLAARRPAVLHLHTPNTEIAHFLSGFIAPGILSRGGGLLFRTIHNTEVPSSWIARLAYRGNRASCSIACGTSVAAAYAPVISGNLVCVSNGISFSPSVRSIDSTSIARQRLELTSGGFHVLNIGRMGGATLGGAQKAHDVLIRAWIKSGLGQRDGVLHLLGEGNLLGDLTRLANGDASIRFHGVRSDVELWMQAADCFVMPSRFEGLPIAAIEAIGASLPCVFSDIPSLRELTPPLVRWCSVDDVESLARQLKLAAEERQFPSVDQVEAFQNRYSIDRTAKEYLEIYRRHGSKG